MKTILTRTVPLILVFLYSTISMAAMVVAVIDTGLDRMGFPEASLWTNAGEVGVDSKGRDKRTNGVDDDGNGFIDDVHGFNFAENKADFSDSNGHGTHIAGIIRRQSPETHLMILKYYAPHKPHENLKNTARAIDYAVKMGAQVINYSGGGRLPDEQELQALQRAERAGLLVVAASGNEGYNNDQQGFYPASYKLRNIISVASTQDDGRLLPSSNFGAASVMIAARGEKVLSDLPLGRKGRMTGTSQAAALVSGVASRLFAEFKTKDFELVKSHLLRSGRIEPSLWGRTRTGRFVDLERALASRDTSQNAMDRSHPVHYKIFENDFIYKTQ